MKHSIGALVALVGVVIATSAAAQSPYSIDLVLTQTAPAACDGTLVEAQGTGTSTANLPDTTSNVQVRTSVNGGPPVFQYETIAGPFPNTETFSDSTVAFFIPNAPTPPYTAVALYFPAGDGVPTGVGVRVDITCNADTSATVVITNGIAAPAEVGVPALDGKALAALVALLAFGGLATLRRHARVR
jgi:hypothetical protein